MRTSYAASWIRSLTKMELHQLVNEVHQQNRDAISRAVEFVCAESLGLWHNRARAKLCRHFKNHPPSNEERKRMVEAICSRLVQGHFYEQFKDQLSMAIRFAPDRMTDAAAEAAQSDKDYVRRYASWVVHALNSQQSI